jgi:hypothetical protein
VTARESAISYGAFVADVLKVTLTPAQSVLCRVAFDREQPSDLDPDDRDIAAELFGPDVDLIPDSARAVLVGVFGARSGKSRFLGGTYSLWRALVADLSGLAPGETGSALIVGPDLRLGRQTLRFALGAAHSVSSIERLIESETSDAFSLRRPDGALVAIETLPATRGGSATRGRTLVSAVLDESAFFRDADYLINDEEVFRAVSPRVLDGGLTVIVSTPWAEAGLLFAEFDRNFNHPRGALACRGTTLLMNPSKRAEVERERERDPENARREFDAEFLARGVSTFFDPVAINQAVDSELRAG